jgi:hypothetical protein
MSGELFVPADFAVPDGLIRDDFRLIPLGPRHNEADYAAWTGSIEHIRATPGFAGRSWPREMSVQDNLRDLERHAQDFADRRGFTYTVLSAESDDVIGCVYIYPPKGQTSDGSTEGQPAAAVMSWLAPTAPTWTVSSTTRSPHGWNAPGPLALFSTHPGTDRHQMRLAP